MQQRNQAVLRQLHILCQVCVITLNTLSDSAFFKAMSSPSSSSASPADKNKINKYFLDKSGHNNYKHESVPFKYVLMPTNAHKQVNQQLSTAKLLGKTNLAWLQCC